VDLRVVTRRSSGDRITAARPIAAIWRLGWITPEPTPASARSTPVRLAIVTERGEPHPDAASTTMEEIPEVVAVEREAGESCDRHRGRSPGGERRPQPSVLPTTCATFELTTTALRSRERGTSAGGVVKTS